MKIGSLTSNFQGYFAPAKNNLLPFPEGTRAEGSGRKIGSS
jgi:hypothetical protein